MKSSYCLTFGVLLACITVGEAKAASEFTQPPTENQESIASNIDWADVTPNVALTDDFISDGRPITTVRWWGSELDLMTPSDGWLISFHEPLETEATLVEPLGIYFCPSATVQQTPAVMSTCDAGDVIQYATDLADCCMIRNNPDTRTGIIPAQPAAFDPGICLGYDLTIQAVVGRTYAEGPVMSIPTFLGSVDGQSTHSMWPTDDGKFVVTGEERSGGGIHVFEIIDNGGSVTLIERDSLELPGEAFSVHNQIIIGNRLYCSWYEAGLRVLDIDPTTGQLQEVAVFDTPSAWGVYPFLGDDKILISDMSAGLLIYDLTTDTLVGSWDEYTGMYSDIWADGDFVYLPNYAGGDGRPAIIHVLDISDPTDPVLANTIALPPPNSSSSPQDVKVVDGLLFVALEGGGADGAAIFDVRNPPAATLLATVRVPFHQNVHNLFYHDGFLYLSGTGNRVAIVDLTEFDPDNPPPSPITTAKWMLGDIGAAYVHDVTVIGGRLYAAAWDSGLWIYDITNTEPACVPTTTGNAATGDFWGWHTTADENGNSSTLTGALSVEFAGDWLYGPWAALAPSCGSPNLAFELLTTEPDPEITCQCTTHGECDDSQLCTYDRCIDGVCASTPIIYGDVNHNGAVNVFDLFCIMNAFGGDFTDCSFQDDDLDPCGGNGTINIFDLFVILNAFGGEDPCCSGSP